MPDRNEATRQRRRPKEELPLLGPFAVDATQLLAADSYLRPTASADKSDPRADGAFKLVTTLFCNKTVLWYAQARAFAPSATPLMGQWKKTVDEDRREGLLSEVDETPRRTLTDAGKKEAYCGAARSFAKWIGQEDGRPAHDVACWTFFQVSDDRMMDIFWKGENTADDLKEAYSYLEPFKLPLLRRAIAREVKYVHRASLASLPSWRSGDFALAYAFYAFCKGRLYYYRLPQEPVYATHWLRDKAMPHDERDRERRLVLSRHLFPWGRILHRLHSKSSFGVEPEGFAESLAKLRKYTMSEPGSPLNRHYDTLQTVLEDTALDALWEAFDWLPERRAAPDRWKTAASEAVAEGVKALLAIATQTGAAAAMGLVMRLLHLGRAANWFDRGAYFANRYVRTWRERFWSTYLDFGLKETVQNHIRGTERPALGVEAPDLD